MKVLCNERGEFVTALLITAGVAAVAVYGINKVTGALETKGKHEQTVEQIEHNETKEEEIQEGMNQHLVRKAGKKVELKKTLKRSNDPKKRSDAAFDYLERK